MKVTKKLFFLFILVTSLNANDYFGGISLNNVRGDAKVNSSDDVDIESTRGASIKAGTYIDDYMKIYFDISKSKWGNAQILSIGINLDHVLNIYKKYDFYYGIDIDKFKVETELTDNNSKIDNGYGLKLGFIKRDLLDGIDLDFGVSYKKLNITTSNNTTTYEHEVESLLSFYAGIEF